MTTPVPGVWVAQGVEEGERPSEPHFLPVPDTTDFQESFVTSGVFSVTELIQVSRSKCPRPLCAGIRGGEGLPQERGTGEGEGALGGGALREKGSQGEARSPSLCHQAKVPRKGSIRALPRAQGQSNMSLPRKQTPHAGWRVLENLLRYVLSWGLPTPPGGDPKGRSPPPPPVPLPS